MINLLRACCISILIFSAGCQTPEVDTSPPAVEFLSFQPKPIEEEICGQQDPTVFILSNNDELNFDAVFSDDEALSQFKVDIHNNFDCHGHGGSGINIDVPEVDNQTVDWTVLDIHDISGTAAPILWTQNVPDNVTAGNYHFHIQVIDESGNDSPFANFNSLKVKNLRDTIPPVITVQEPSSSSFSISKGESIKFVGTVSDNHSLSEGGNGVLYLSNTDLSTGNTFNTGTVFPFDENIDEAYSFDFEYTIPQTLVPRTYRFSLGAHDGVRNVASFINFEVEVQ